MARAYCDDGLIVIGVHAPEFSFEHDVDGLRRPTRERAIDYPVAPDNDYAAGAAFANHCLPAPIGSYPSGHLLVTTAMAMVESSVNRPRSQGADQGLPRV